MFCDCRDFVEEERAEKQIAAVLQKTLKQQGSHGRKFFYAISRSEMQPLGQQVLIPY